MAIRVIPMRIGDVDLWVETVPVAASTAEIVDKLTQQARCPDTLEVEFGLSFSAKGTVIVVGGEAGATLRVKVVYHAQTTAS